MTLAFSTNDFRNITENRRLSVLSEIFDDRMRVRIREEMGASYTAYAYNNPSRAYDGYGLLSAVVQADPEDTGTVTAELYRIADDMAEHGITEDELSRAVNPILASIKERVKTNDYWLESVLKRASRYPAQLDWCRSFYNDYAAITASEINALARKYLVTDNAATVVVVPDGKQKPTAAPPEAEAPF
ncbi:MAG: insulinase family protein [Desulfobacterales bacterium]